jgi:hypothetical protein
MASISGLPLGCGVPPSAQGLAVNLNGRYALTGQR